MKINVIFSQFCQTKTALNVVFVEFTYYHYIQEFLQNICQGTLKTSKLSNLIQNRRVYKILKINVIFSQFCETKKALREVCVEFKHHHLIQ